MGKHVKLARIFENAYGKKKKKSITINKNLLNLLL